MNKQMHFKYPGNLAAVDGNTAVILCEREASDAAGAYPITPSTQMGEMWAEETARGHLNISGRPLIFIEPEGEHAAAAVTAGLSMTGLRAINFSSGQGIAYMHESLYAAVGKRLTYVLNIGARAMTKASLNVHAGHDDYHCIDDTGFFQVFAKDAQAVADLNLIAHRLAELALTPGAVAQDGFLTTHLIESIRVPERGLIAEYLGRAEDMIDTPTPAQRIVFGPQRRRIPELWDVDNTLMIGVVQNQDAYMQSVAAQRPFYFQHIPQLSQQAFDEYYCLTGRRYDRVQGYRTEDADYLLLGQGSLVSNAEVVVDYLRNTRGIKVGVVNLVMFRPFPDDALSHMLKGKKGVAVLERVDQPLAVELPIMREVRATVSRCLENGRDPQHQPFPGLACYAKPDDAPWLYSGSFGLGSRDLQPEGIIAAIENMLPTGAKRKFFYLSIDFLRDPPASPKQRIHQEEIESSYPQVRQLALRGSENPNLMPPGSITVRMHSVGGWGAITTGKNLAMTLFDLLGYHIKANPKYGSEKKGQPTTYYLSAAPEPIRINSEYFYVDVVLSPDPNVFHHTNALAGIKESGVLILQSDLPDAAAVWRSIPAPYREIIVKKNVQLFYLDAFAIARQEANDPDLQLRMQGIAFQGAFFASAPITKQAGLSDERLLTAIRQQLEKKFGSKGARIVEDNMRVVQRGFMELHAVPHGPVADDPSVAKPTAGHPQLPMLLKRQPQSHLAASDIHRFWEQTGSFYARGQGQDSISDPFIGLSLVPAVTTLFRDMTGIRFSHPQWISENCTACGNCYTVCPDTAIPGLVSEVSQVFETVIQRLRKQGRSIHHLPKAVRDIERLLRPMLVESSPKDKVAWLLEDAIDKTLEQSQLDEAQRVELKQELNWFREDLSNFRFALSQPYFTAHENSQPGSGGLLSITVNPYTCKGCMECVAVCHDDALRVTPQTADSVQQLRRGWEFWLDLPNTPRRFIRVDDLNECVGALHTILLDKQNYQAFASGEGACLGCGEKTVMHLFVSTVEALMQPRIDKHVQHLSDLIERLEKHLRLKLMHGVDVSNPAVVENLLRDAGKGDVTLATIADDLQQRTGGQAIDPQWLRRISGLIAELKQLRWKYTEGHTRRGRARLGMLNATGCSSVWGSTYPYNPYPFPWANHLFQDATSLAMGVFEGHMQKMAQGFKAIRLAELELDGRYDPSVHDREMTYFNWQQFSDQEWQLCPPVVAVGGDGAMYDIGFQNLSRMMMTGKPIKVLILDTQVYSNTGGQACTSGFWGQISDMAQYGQTLQGKAEIRKEIGLIAMAHRTSYVMQSTIAHANHMIEGFVRGLNSRRPALFNLYTSCQPEHGIGDDKSFNQAKLVVESRAYPLFRYDPDAGVRPEECFDLEGNPDLERDWPVYRLPYQDGHRQRTMELPMTFADFAITENRFRKHFRVAPPDTWNENMLPIAEFLELSVEDRQDRFPFVWSVDRQGQLQRLLVASPIVHSCEDRRNFWTMLRSLARVGESKLDSTAMEAKIRRQVAQRLASNILQLALGEAGDVDVTEVALAAGLTEDATAAGATSTVADTAPVSHGQTAAAAGYQPPWIETPRCTSCNECIQINPKIFEYNSQKKAIIKDAQAGPYQDLVKAAERCTARIIHPGLPPQPYEKSVEKWIARGAKYN
ncbi:MAG: 2-oxoacid:acceptor oxidoreductase family protein [Pirellulaceae bacterium]|nr:2-oxoacid:acceptor oxidoreductase family protein [Pirellulaceae bacterium]